MLVCEENAFDRDMVMFDASASLTYIRTVAQPGELYGIISGTDEREVRKFFPRLYDELKSELKDKSRFELVLFRERDEKKWEDYVIDKPATVFIISSRHGSTFKPGSLYRVYEGEILNLGFDDFRNHFIGVAYE